jgi:arginyl-tRNA synthetase
MWHSTILGVYIANLYKDMGWDVVKINYLGDWGKQIGLLGAGWERFGSEEQFQADLSATCSVCTTKSTSSPSPS